MVKVASIQYNCTVDRRENIVKAKNLIILAAEQGANIILLSEFFMDRYFFRSYNPNYLSLSLSTESSEWIEEFSNLSSKYRIVLPISFFEKYNQSYFSSVLVIDSKGKKLGCYRKAHIPKGRGNFEKAYLSHGDLGFKVFDTEYGRIGIGIGWDQMFPEVSRSLGLMGAELLCYPCAFADELMQHMSFSVDQWKTIVSGQSAANMLPIIVSNRVGIETDENLVTHFYGNSFITDHLGNILETSTTVGNSIIYYQYDLKKIAGDRVTWGIFRDRRPDCYQSILTYDGENRSLQNE